MAHNRKSRISTDGEMLGLVQNQKESLLVCKRAKEPFHSAHNGFR